MGDELPITCQLLVAPAHLVFKGAHSLGQLFGSALERRAALSL